MGDFRGDSREVWTSAKTVEHINAGSLQRIADAVAAERERCANLAADLAADACVAYANGEPIAFRTAVGDAIREGQKKG